MKNFSVGLGIGLLVFLCFGAVPIRQVSPEYLTNYVNQVISGATNGVSQWTIPQRFHYRSFTNNIDLGIGDYWIKSATASETYTFSNAPTNAFAQVVVVRLFNNASTNITPTFTGGTFISGNSLTLATNSFGEYTFIVWGDTNTHGVGQLPF